MRDGFEKYFQFWPALDFFSAVLPENERGLSRSRSWLVRMPGIAGDFFLLLEANEKSVQHVRCIRRRRRLVRWDTKARWSGLTLLLTPLLVVAQNEWTRETTWSLNGPLTDGVAVSLPPRWKQLMIYVRLRVSRWWMDQTAESFRFFIKCKWRRSFIPFPAVPSA